MSSSQNNRQPGGSKSETSFMKIEKSSGPRLLPCGTPDRLEKHSDTCDAIFYKNASTNEV